MKHATKDTPLRGRTSADRTGFGRVYGAPSSYSPTFGEVEFSEVELPLYGVLRSSLPASNAQATPKNTQYRGYAPSLDCVGWLRCATWRGLRIPLIFGAPNRRERRGGTNR